MQNALVKEVWLVHQSCDTSLQYPYYVAIATDQDVNYRTRGLKSLDSVDFQLKRLKPGTAVSLTGLQLCDSSGYTLFDETDDQLIH